MSDAFQLRYGFALSFVVQQNPSAAFYEIESSHNNYIITAGAGTGQIRSAADPLDVNT